MNSRVLWIAFAVAVIVIILVRPGRQPEPEPIQNAAPEVERQGSRVAQARPAALDLPARPPRHPALDLLAEPAPSAAQPFIVRGIQTVQLIEQHRRRFPKDSHGARLLEGLARKLFMDDYRYAALATGEMDAAGAEAAYDALAARVSATTVYPAEFDMSVDLEPVELSDHDLPPLTVERMAEHHAAFMSNAANPVYQTVWAAVEPYDPSAQTDLYKDALLFAAQHAEMTEWIDREKKELLVAIDRMGEISSDPDQFERSMQSHREMTDRMISEYAYVQEATQQIFEERFRARGIEDPEFIQQLKGLAMQQTLPDRTRIGVGGTDFDFP